MNPAEYARQYMKARRLEDVGLYEKTKKPTKQPRPVFNKAFDKGFQKPKRGYAQYSYEQVEHNGKTQSLRQWAKELGIPFSTCDYRHRNKYTARQILGLDPPPPRTLSASHKAAISKGLTGRSLSAEHRAALSRAASQRNRKETLRLPPK
jgi:hypothetical protein